PNMDALVGLAILSAYTYSAYATLTGRVEVYFDVATILVVVIGIGKSIELRLKRYASKSIQDIVERDTDQANLVTENGLQNIQIDDIQKGQTLLVKNGEEIPVDGRIVKGSTTVDEAIMTGE
ncbi:MAG: hypothetical protein GWN86_07295, partial [Desulfobacterales bacterium]|nr:hypothetical protein [Desulfobacterales bacterium]